MKHIRNRRICKLIAVTLACLQLAGCSALSETGYRMRLQVYDVLDSIFDPRPGGLPREMIEPSPITRDSDDTLLADATLNNPLAADWPVLYDAALTPAAESVAIAPDFSNVINAGDIDYWSDEAKNKLQQNGFVVANSTEYEFYGLYEANRYSYTPNYVTVDALLHTYHLYYQYLQRGIEEKQLSAMLGEISAAMQAESQAQYEALKGSEWENAALRNVAFFGVGANLLNPGTAVPTEAAELVNAELALIDAAGAIVPSPLMNLNAAPDDLTVQEDYTQYIPRSYYTQSETLQRYFKAMMWYGRMNFLQSNEDLNRSALLMTMALKNSGSAENWERLYNITAFFAGASDDAGYIDYAPLLADAYGNDATAESLAGDTGKWERFEKNAAALRPAAINSMPIMQSDDREDTALALRFMGQRFTFDATIFSNLTYRNVEENGGKQRLLPDALDVPAALGSDLAVSIMDGKGLTDYPNYTEQLEETRAALAAAPESAWQSSLYGGWLNTLRPLTERKGTGYPTFMQNDAWATRGLSSFLGCWTELKHDSALYAKQSYGEMGGGGPDEVLDDRGYVEAEPVVFGRLAALTQVTKDGLKTMGVLSDADAESLDRMYTLNLQLMQIAEKELRGELPSDEEFDLIRTVGGQLEHFWLEVMSDEISKDQYFTAMQHPAALVADVATDPNGRVLQTGTDVGNIYVVVSVEGKLRIASGVVFNFFQFEQPISERMTDQQWWVELGKMVGDDGELHWDDIPAPADWTSVFSVDTLWHLQ